MLDRVPRQLAIMDSLAAPSERITLANTLLNMMKGAPKAMIRR